jgi:M6 family metalloprotease-like protein
MSHPFSGAEFTFTQPNGEKFKVRGWGDQSNARFETLDGFTVVRNPANGYYEIAERTYEGALAASGHRPGVARSVLAGIAPGLRAGTVTARRQFRSSALTGKTRWQQRNEQAKAALRARMTAGGPMAAPPQRQTVGTFVGLCLPIQFPDIPTAITSAQIGEFCNKPGYNGFGNNGSVRDYFLANSVGKCDYSTVVAPVYTARHRRDHYTDPSQPYGKRAQELIHEALAHHKANGFDFTPLSADDRRFIYAINVFYAGGIVNNWSEGLWPHAHFLANQVTLAPGRIAHDYQITALGDELELGTYCHENGHMLCDFPDLYDYDYDSAGVGKFCLMCAGNHADQRNPVQIGAYLKFKAGWAGSITPLANGLHAQAAADGNHFFLLRKTLAEYYILENRQKAGRDAALPDAGLAIWHVDEEGDNQNQQDDPTLHYECALIQADGRQDLEHNVNQGDVDDLFGPGKMFSGRWWDRQSIGIRIANIGSPGPAIAFEVNDTLTS